MIASIPFGSTRKRRIEIIAEAPQSIKKLASRRLTKKQVFRRPPEPNASPQPRNFMYTGNASATFCGIGNFSQVASELVRYLASIAMTSAATVVAVGVDSKVTIPNLSLVFVVPVIISGVGLGLGPSLCSAILGALVFNFFLTEPRYSLAVDDPANIWAIGLLFVVGLIVSGVAFTSRQRATEAAQLRRQTTVLQGYSRDVVAADNTKAIVSITSQALAALFQVPVVVMLVTEGRLVFLEQVGDIGPEEAELEAARSSLAPGIVARG